MENGYIWHGDGSHVFFQLGNVKRFDGCIYLFILIEYRNFIEGGKINE